MDRRHNQNHMLGSDRFEAEEKKASLAHKTSWCTKKGA